MKHVKNFDFHPQAKTKALPMSVKLMPYFVILGIMTILSVGLLVFGF